MLNLSLLKQTQLLRGESVLIECDDSVQVQGAFSTLRLSLVEHEATLLLCECAVTLMYNVVRCETKMDVGVALATFIRTVTGRPVVVNLVDSGYWSKFEELFQDEMTVQGWTDEVKGMRVFLDRYDEIKNSKLVEKLHKLAMYCLSLHIFDKAGITFDKLRYSKVEAAAIQQQFHLGPNMFYCVIDTIVFLCERGSVWMRTGNFSSFLHSGDTYQEWYDRCVSVRERSQLLNDPELHGFSEPEYQADLEYVLDKGKAIYEHAKILSSSERKIIGKMLSDMKMIRADYMSLSQARKTRPVPFSILLNGTTGMGKSNLVDLLFVMFGKWHKLPVSEEFMYTRMPGQEFWSGFKTSSWCLLLDDMAAMHPTLAQAGLDSMLTEVIQIQNNVAMGTNQAAVEDKGRVPFRGQLTVATSNVKHLNSKFVYSYPIAMLRRLPFVVNVKVRPEFCSNAMLDPSKVPDDPIPDIWSLTVEHVVPKVSEGVIDERSCCYMSVQFEGVNLENVDIFTFLRWFRAASIQHRQQQKRLAEVKADFRNLVVCEQCGLVECMCQIQSDQEPRDFVQPDPHVDDFVSAVHPDSHEVEYQYVTEDGSPAHNLEQSWRVPDFYTWSNPGQRLISKWTALFPIICLWLMGWTLHLYVYFGAKLFRAYLPKMLCVVQDEFDKYLYEYLNWMWHYGFPTLKYVALTSFPITLVGGVPAVNRTAPWLRPAWFATAKMCCGIVCQFGLACLVNLGMSIGHPIFMWIASCYYGPFVTVLNVLGFLHWFPWHTAVVSRCIFNAGRREHMGVKVSRWLVIMTASAILVRSVVHAMAKLYSLTIPTQVQSVDESIKQPVPSEKPTPNVYYKDDFVLTPVDVSSLSTSWKTKSPGEMRDVLRRNCLFVKSERTVDGTTYDAKFRVFGLVDQWYLTNAHNVLKADSIKYTVQGSLDQVSGTHSFIVTESMIHRFGEDLALVRFPHCPPVRNVVQLFPTRSFGGVWNGYRLVADAETVRIERVAKLIDAKMWAAELHTNVSVWSGMSEVGSSFGYCGSVYIAETPLGPVCVGIHLLGSEMHTRCAATKVFREDLEAALNKVCPLAVQGEFCPDLALTELHKKDPLRFVESGLVDVYGSLGYHAVQRSNVIDSCLRPLLEARGFSTTATKPVLNGWRPNRRALLEVVAPRTVIQTQYIDRAVVDYCDKLCGAEDSVYSVIHPVSLDVALNGCAGVAHLERLNFSTSAGYPHNCTKKKFINLESFVPQLDDSIRIEAEQLMAKYERGERAFPIFNACFKDEPTSQAKVDAFKTRVFLISPFAKTLVDRQLFLGHIRFFTENRHLSEMAVGICAQNLEWTLLAQHLLKMGSGGLMDGDFKGFDTSQSAILVYAVRDVFIALCTRAGWSSGAKRAVAASFFDLMFAVVNWFGTLIGMRKRNPSGCVITTMINCVTVSIVVRASYFYLLDVNVNQALHAEYLFSDRVILVSYGDDSVQSVHESIRGWYNQVTLASALKTFGFEYTMADKDAEIVPFVQFSDLSFLKRKWVWSSDVRGFLAPLDWNSIVKMLLVGMKSKSVCEEVRVCATISSAVREAFFHGPRVFEELRETLCSVVKQLHLERWVESSTFPTYGELRSLFIRSSLPLYIELGRVAPEFDEPAAQETPQLLLDVQGCEMSRCVGGVVSHQGVPQSSFLGKRRLDAIYPNPCVVWVKHDGGLIRPSKRFFKNFNQAIDFASQHFYAVSPELWARVERLERTTECACDFCRPCAREHFGCFDDDCEYCEKAFAPTLLCPYGDQISPSEYKRNMTADEGNVRYFVQSEQQQADTLGVGETDNSVETYQGVVGFADKTEGVTIDLGGEIDDVRSQHYIASADLSNFLERPALIHTQVWNETDPVGTLWAIAPWNLYFNNPTINRKLDNYSAISCDLHVKFVVNSSPFFYGATCVAYEPLNHNNTDASASSQSWFIPYSQRPRVWIYASNSQGGELTLPFFYHKDWLLLNDTDTSNMGTFTGFVVNQLASANGVAGAAITIQVWAWATNVKLLGPTRLLAMQSRQQRRGRTDEYKKSGALSSTASAVASVARATERIPVIGQFASATAEVADMVGDLASIFGFTNPPVIEDVKPMVIKPFANFASSDISTAYEKLSMDTRNEVTVDTRLAGLDGSDELMFNALLQRESFLCSALFSTTNAIDDVLFSTLVRPNGLLATDTATLPQTIVHTTPLDYFSRLMGFWKGSIIFRFKCVCTPYHRARVRLCYDPIADTAATSPDYVQVFNQVIDIGETTDFEVVVPYMQSVGWLKTDPSRVTPVWRVNSAVAQPYDRNFDNGVLSLRVVTLLTTPAAAGNLYFQVFVRAGPDFEVAGPGNLPQVTYLPVQSQQLARMDRADGAREGEMQADVSYGSKRVFHIGNEPANELHPQTHAVYFGEKIVSARQLLRRTTYSYSSQFPTSTADLAIYRSIQTPFPPWYGYSANGRHTANNTNGAGTSPFNYVAITPFNWIAPAFVAFRGSMHWSYNLDTQSFDQPINMFSAARQNGTFTVPNYNEVINTTATTNSQYARGMLLTAPTGAAGMALQNTRTNTSLQVSIPYYNRFRFTYSWFQSGDRGNAEDGSDFNAILVYATTNPSKTTKPTSNIRLDKYFCIGPDFNFLFFLNAPAMIFFPAPTTP